MIYITFNGVSQTFFMNSLRSRFLEGLYIVEGIFKYPQLAKQTVTLKESRFSRYKCWLKGRDGGCIRWLLRRVI